MTTRIAPASIEAGRAPGGVVFRAYNPAGLLLLERRLFFGDELEQLAEIDGDAVRARLEAAGYHQAVLAAYDGDTGEGMPLPL